MDVFYARQGTENSGYVDQAFLDGVAEAAGVDVEQMNADMSTPRRSPTKRSRTPSPPPPTPASTRTPSFLVGPTGGDLEPVEPGGPRRRDRRAARRVEVMSADGPARGPTGPRSSPLILTLARPRRRRLPDLRPLRGDLTGLQHRRLRAGAGLELLGDRRHPGRAARPDRLRRDRRSRCSSAATSARASTFLLTLIGFGFSVYLTYLELFVIDAICQWCVASAVLMTALLVTATIRLLRPEAPDRPAPA